MSGTSIMTTSMQNQPPTLMSLPTEILVEIFNLVNDTDLPTARLVCKEFCDAVTPRFALVNFTERSHVVSPHSIDALVDITEHPVFGGYVKTVAICSVRRTNLPRMTSYLPEVCVIEERDQKALLNAYVKTRRFARRMERVFSNIKFRSESVTISINDQPSTNAVTRKRCYGWTQLSSMSNSTLIAYQTVETLEETVYAARRVRCRIKCLNMNFSMFQPNSRQAGLEKAIHEILQSNLTPLSIDLGDEQSDQVAYDNESQYLKLQVVDLKYRLHESPDPPIHAPRDWLLTRKIKSLKVAWVDNYEIDNFRPFLTAQLSSLELHALSIYSNHFGHASWSEHIQGISKLSGLQHCRLSDLSYLIDLHYSDGLYCMELPGHGQYSCESEDFHLAFRDGSEFIEIHGGDVCEKLKELACYVAAAEAQKVQTIISDDGVNDFTVGILDKV